MPFRNVSHHRCPRCGVTALNEANAFGVNRYKCQTCFGSWLTWEEVLRQFEAFGLSSTERVFEASTTSDQLRCPNSECNRVMRSVTVAANTTIDFCTNHGFWFDHGELSTTLSEASGREPAPIQPLRVRLAWLGTSQSPNVRTAHMCSVCLTTGASRCAMCADAVCSQHLVAGRCMSCAT